MINFQMRTGGQKILVVDDVVETLDGIEILLRHDNYCVATARNVRDAVMKARIAAPDLMLVSLEGELAEVVAAAEHIRRRTVLQNKLPVIIFCVGEVTEGGETCIGENIYLAHPDNFDQLREFISELLIEFPEIILI